MILLTWVFAPTIPFSSKSYRKESCCFHCTNYTVMPQIAKSTGPTWIQSGSCRLKMSPMLAPGILLSGACVARRKLSICGTPVIFLPIKMILYQVLAFVHPSYEAILDIIRESNHKLAKITWYHRHFSLPPERAHICNVLIYFYMHLVNYRTTPILSSSYIQINVWLH